MQAWFDELSRREQLTLIGGGIALALMMFYLLLWAPLNDERSRLHNEVQVQQETLAWMQQAATQVKGSGAASVSPARGGSLLTLVDRSAKTAKMGGAIKRIQPDKDGRVRIWLEGVNFDLMMRWLGGLSRDQGVSLIEVNVERFESSALVKARLTLEREAK